MKNTAYESLVLSNYSNHGDRRQLIKTEKKPLQYPEFASSIQTCGANIVSMLSPTSFNKEIIDKT